MSFPKYPAYKDSGVEWLGRIPSQWESLPGRRLFDNVRAPASSGSQQLAVTQSHGVIPQEAYMEMQGHRVVLALSGTDNFKAVSVNDFVISLRSFQGGLEHSCYSGCVSPAYTVLRPKSEELVASSYFRYLLKSREYVEALQAATTGIRDGKTITYDQFGSIPLPLVPMQEQLTIAGFLDSETSRIDALIAEQQRLIELLKEKRQAVISQAVTKGLDPSVPMKDSGVEWLGEVPEHWLIGRLKNLVRIRSGHDYKHVETDDPDGFPVIGSGGLFARATNYLFDGESVLLGRKGTIDKPLYVNGRFWTVDTMFYTEINESASAKFVYYAAMTIPFAYYSTNTALPSMSQFDLANHLVAIPPYSEQQLIADFLSNQTSNTDALVAMAEDTTKLLTERRSALISAAVTGKIDVLNWQPQSTTDATDLEELVANG